MSKAMLIHENGGPEKMQLADVDVGEPGPGQVKVRHTAIGLNFIDIYTRSGLYQTPLPNAVGREAAGVITAVGPKVKGFKKGDRVAYCGVLGAYWCRPEAYLDPAVRDNCSGLALADPAVIARGVGEL